MTDWAEYLIVSDLQVADFDDWTEGEIQYLIDILNGQMTPAAVPSGRAKEKAEELKPGDLATLLEAKASKSEIRIITPFNIERFLNEHGFIAERWIEMKGEQTVVKVHFSDGETKLIFDEVCNIIVLPDKITIPGIEMPKLVVHSLFARLASLLASFLKVDSSNTETKGQCLPSVQFLSFTQCGMKTVLNDNQIRTITTMSFFKNYPICNSLELAHMFMVRLNAMQPSDALMFIHLILTRLFPNMFLSRNVEKVAISKVAPDFAKAFRPYPPAIQRLLKKAMMDKKGLDMPVDSPYLPQRLSAGIPVLTSSVKQVTLDVLLEYIPKARAARGEDMQNSSAFTSDYIFGGFHNKRYILAETLAHIVAVVYKKYPRIGIKAKKSVLDIVCAISKSFPDVVFYVEGQPLNTKDVARFPRVFTKPTLDACEELLLIDLDLPPLVPKGSKEVATTAIAGWDIAVKRKVALYMDRLKADACIIASRVYDSIKNMWAYSYASHSLAGYYSTFDWAQVASPTMQKQLAPITVDFTVKSLPEDPKVTAFWMKSYRINKCRTFYALTLSGVQGLMAWADPGEKEVVYRYLTNYYREYTTEGEGVENLTPAEIALNDDAELHVSDEGIVAHDKVDDPALMKISVKKSAPSSTSGSQTNLPVTTQSAPVAKEKAKEKVKLKAVAPPVADEELEMIGMGGDVFGADS